MQQPIATPRNAEAHNATTAAVQNPREPARHHQSAARLSSKGGATWSSSATTRACSSPSVRGAIGTGNRLRVQEKRNTVGSAHSNRTRITAKEGSDT